MIISRTIVVLGFLISASLIGAQDLSSYRGFQFGMSLDAVAKQTGMDVAEAKTLHQRPSRITSSILLHRGAIWFRPWAGRIYRFEFDRPESSSPAQ